MDDQNENASVRVLCRKLVITKNEPGLQWLIGSPFFPLFTIISTFRCIHTLSSNPLSPDYFKESDDLRTLLLKGFDVIGALIVGKNSNSEQICGEVIDASRKIRKLLSGDDNGGKLGNQRLIGGVVDSNTGDVQFFVSRSGNLNSIESVTSVVYEENPEKYIWERGCILRCELPIKLPVYFGVNSPKDAENMYLCATDAVAAKFRDPQVSYMVETLNEPSTEVLPPVILRGAELDYHTDLSNARLKIETTQESDAKVVPCLYFCSKTKDISLFSSMEEDLNPAPWG